MNNYTVGVNNLEFTVDNMNLIVRNLYNQATMTIPNFGLPNSEKDVEYILILFRNHLVE